jgi:hypothetical protein
MKNRKYGKLLCSLYTIHRGKETTMSNTNIVFTRNNNGTAFV